MELAPPLNGKSAKAEAVSTSTAQKTPESKFQALAKRLLRVNPTELAQAEAQWEKSRTERFDSTA